jgi:PKD repeat protein
MFRKFTAFILIAILSLVVMAPALASTPTTVPGGDVSGIWDAAGSPYLIEGDITVPSGATLAIEPGVEVLFQGWYSLTVNGTLIADGDEGAPILFGGGHPSAGWPGIRFVDAADGSRLTYAIVENGRATGADPLNKGGGIYVDNSSPLISYSTIRNNQAKYSGGGIYLNNSNAILMANKIVGNTAGQNGASANGGGLAILYSNPVVTENVISGNSVSIAGGYTTPSGYGGGLFVRSSNGTFTRNLISDNHVNAQLNSNARGGGLYLYYGSPNFVNNTITGNSIENESSGVYAVKEGGGIYAYYANPVFVNNILWNDAPQESFIYRNSASFAYSDVQGGQAGIVTDNAAVNWVEGNANLDPRFVDAASDDFSLASNSQLIDAGTAFFEWNGTTIVDLGPGDYNGSAPDMGAFEFGSGSIPNQPPVAVASVTPDHGSAPLNVQFSSAGSYDPDGNISATAWDFGDGNSSTESSPSHTYAAVGTFQATLTVTDDNGATHSDTISVEVQDGTTVYAGEVSGTWSASGSPYRIEGDITVPAGQSLAIEAGVEISFQSWYSLVVNGTLTADGSATEPILFTAVSASPGWRGIRFVDAAGGSLLNYVIVERGRASGAAPYDSGGGIYALNTDLVISNSTIRDNYAKVRGGGIYLDGSNAELVGNAITGNQAGQGSSASGGCIYMSNSDSELTNNVIKDNWVYVAGSYTTPSGLGGGIYASQSNPTLRGNLIQGNAVQGSNNRYARGGAIYLNNSDPDLINNTITGNTVGTGGTYYIVLEGGGIYAYQSEPTIVNSILWNDMQQEIFAADSYADSTITVAYSDVRGGQAGIVTNDSALVNWEPGNIDSDPRFTDAANADFTLQETSPAVDAGTAYFAWNGRVLVDLGATEYNGAAPDMGAFESPYLGGGSNQPPVAVASADPDNGNAPLTVQFSSDGSYDPDGAIVAFAWDFGDGSSSSEANPVHTYADAGSYDAVLTITDEDGNTGTATVTIDVVVASQNEFHVQAQNVSREQVNRRHWRGVDAILIADQNNQPVAGANVTASYTGPNQGQASGVTGADGMVTLFTDRQRKPQGSWCFEVFSVTKDGFSYDPSANVVTLQCE